MLSSCCSPSLSQRPIVVPSLSSFRVRVRVPNQPANPTRLTQIPSDSFPKRWKVCCFRHEQDSGSSDSVNPKRENVEQFLPKEEEAEEKVHELVKPKHGGNDWISKLREAANKVVRAFGSQWTVPWTAGTIVQVMLLWVVSFWFIGSWVIPFAAHAAGFNKESLTLRGQALFSLVTDVAEGLAGIAILRRCLSPFCPLPSDWFSFKLKGNWWFDVALGCLMFPVVTRLSQFNLSLLPILPSTPVTLSSVEQSIAARDPVAMALYAIVVTICAPVWEEIVFRGFLLPSLTRYMPIWCAILVSSVAFALAHFNVQRMLPLVFLGVVVGVIFARSRSLLPSMVLHSLWNAFVFLDLMT